MESNKIYCFLFILLSICVIICLSISSLAFYKANEGEWICIAKKCDKWVRGDEWVSQFCRPNENKTDMVCSLVIENKQYNIPLSQLDTTNASACVSDICMVEVKVKQSKGG